MNSLSVGFVGCVGLRALFIFWAEDEIIFSGQPRNYFSASQTLHPYTPYICYYPTAFITPKKNTGTK